MNKFQFISRLAVYVMLLNLSACAPSAMDAHFLSLDIDSVPNLQIVREGKHDEFWLLGDASIPLEYSMDNERYSLSLSVSAPVLPGLNIELHSNDGSEYLIGFERDSNKRSGGIICESFYPDKEDKSKLGFGWSLTCDSESIAKELRLTVRSSDGLYSDSVSFPFELVKNGKYFFIDAI